MTINGGQIPEDTGVTSLNLLTGAVELIGGSNITITTVDNSLRIDASTGGAGIASINSSTVGAQTLVSSNTNILTVVTNTGTGNTVFSLITGTSANDLIQLNASAQLPGIDIGSNGLVVNPVTSISSTLNTALANILAAIPVYSVKQTSVNYQILTSDDIIEVEANNLNITLPDATILIGKIYYINNSSVTGTMVIPLSGQFINDTLTTWTISDPYNGAAFYSNGTGWRTT